MRFAQEGADIIALDVCGPVDTVIVPPATLADLDETVRLVAEAGGRIVGEVVDVRDTDEVQAATDRGVEQLGALDVSARQRGSRRAPWPLISARTLGRQCLTST